MGKTNGRVNMQSDAEAILACQSGKTEAYRFIVDKYRTRAYYAALLYTHNRDDAMDLSQDAFVRAFRAIKHFDTRKNFYTWFYKILKNLCINHLNRLKHRASLQDGLIEEDHSRLMKSDIANPEEIFEHNESSEILWEAINRLKDNDREIIILKEFDDMSYQEIAEILEIPIGSVMSRLYYARKRLLKQLEQVHEEI